MCMHAADIEINHLWVRSLRYLDRRLVIGSEPILVFWVYLIRAVAFHSEATLNFSFGVFCIQMATKC
jgi:hypothetical protein